MDLRPEEIRILGCLVEKQRTTPAVYPLSLNALRLACNQATNRDPVVEYDDGMVRDALERLARRRLVRLASGHGSRTTKYRHLLDEALGVGVPELSVLAVLMLRGPQTPGELRARTERMHPFPGHEELAGALDVLISKGLVARLERRPGQKEERYAQLLSDDAEPAAAPAPAPATAAMAASPYAAAEPPAGGDASLADRVAALEAEVEELREALSALSNRTT